MTKSFLLAAGQGAVAGMLYGLLEYATMLLAPMIRWRPSTWGPEHWKFEAMFLVLYTALGALIGCATALVRTKNPGLVASRVVVAVILLSTAFGQILSNRITAANLLLDLSLTMLAAAALASLAVTNSSKWLRWMTSPWIAIPVMMVLIKLKGLISGTAVFSATAIGFLIGTAAVIWMAARSRPLSGMLDKRSLPWGIAACVLLGGGLLATSLSMDAAPRLPQRAGASAAGQSRPNVMLIVLDTVRADHLSLYGYGRRTTPYLEELAREAVVFRNAVSSSDITISSHGSLFTSLYASWHGAYVTGAHDLDRSYLTMAEALSHEGYGTLAVLANCAYLRAEFGMDQGFEFYDVRATVRGNGAINEYYLRDLARPVLDRFTPTMELDRPYRSARQITDGVLRVITERPAKNQPFFLSINYMDAHEPYIPPSPYRELFGGKAVSNERLKQLRSELAQPQQKPQTSADLKNVVALYDGGIAFMDAEVKRVTDAMKQAGIYDDTMIVITSDHGEALGERGALGHPFSVYQELVHVPLMIKYPRSAHVEPGRQIEWPVSGVDVMPTVLDVAGIPMPPTLQGVSLHKLEREPDRMVLAESFLDEYLRSSRHLSEPEQRALFQGKWKFIRASGKQELYDLSCDPTESKNLFNADEAVSVRFRGELDRLLQTMPRRVSPKKKKMNDVTLERLRGLGYIQGSAPAK